MSRFYPTFVLILNLFAVGAHVQGADIVRLATGHINGETGLPPEYDWTARAGDLDFGVLGEHTYTCIAYGQGYVTLHVPFWGVICFAALLLLTPLVWFVIRHRRHENAA